MFKKLFFLAFLLLAGASSFSQTSDAFKYQAVLRSGGTQVIANQNVGLRFSVREGNPNGVEVYSEEHFVVTNPIGLVNLEIGNGQNVFGDLRTLNWGDQRYFVRTELDAAGGSNFVFLGVSELLAVPYAFKAGDVVQKQDIIQQGDSIQITDNPNATWIDLSQLRDNTDDQSMRFQNGLVILTRELTEDTVDINPYVQARLNQFGLDSVLNVNNQAAGQDIVGLGRLGVGTTVPQYALDVLGRVSTDSLQVRSNAQAGYVLTSDANGVATWQASPIQGLDSVLSVSDDANGRIIRNLDSLGIGGSPQYTLHIIDTVDNTSANYNYSIFGQISGGTVPGRFRAGMYLELDGTNGENIAIDGTSLGASAGTNTGVGGYARGSSTYNRGIQASGDGGQTAVGIEALANGGAQQTVAVFGQAANSGGDQAGVRGVVDSAGTTNAGRNWGVNGFVLSESTTPNGNIGVEGAAQGSHTGDNIGVQGVATGGGNNTGGVFSAGASSVGGTNFSIGAQGNAQQANSGFNYGLYGRASNSTAINRGVVGDLSGATNRNGGSGLHLQDAAVYGFTNSTGWSAALLGRANGSNPSDTNVALLGFAQNGQKNYALWTEEGDAMFNDTAIFNYGSIQNGYILTSDANGRATWQPNAADSTRLIDADTDTRVEVEQGTDDDLIRFTLRGTEYFRMDTGRIEFLNTGESVFIGEDAGLNDDKTNAGVFIGYLSGVQNTTGEFNTFVGHRSGANNTIGSLNSFFGSGAGSRNTTGGSNAFFGQNAGLNNTTGIYNVFLGTGVAFSNTTGGSNVYIGREAAFDATTASDNVVIGAMAERTNISGTNNVIIGTHAGGGAPHSKSGAVYIGAFSGGADTTDNKLYIDNSSTTQPLIYGDFANDSLRFNGAVEIRDDLYLPSGANNGYVLTSNASGKASWQAIVAGNQDSTRITDGDGDTKIEVEQAADDDQISFTLGGTEYFRMDSARIGVFNSGFSVFIGEDAGRLDDFSNNEGVFVGRRAGYNQTTGLGNVAIGASALNSNSTTNQLTAVGYQALSSNTTGFGNTAIGASVLSSNIAGNRNTALGQAAANAGTGSDNTSLGYAAGNRNVGGASNVSIGSQADFFNAGGSNNVIIGRFAGYVGASHSKSGSVMIGNQAGFNETSSNKLYIDNSSTNKPLIYGDFAADSLRVNGSLFVRDGLMVDTANAQNGYVLTSDANGKATWQSASTSAPQNIDSVLAVGSDAGNDTIYNLRMLGIGTTAPTATIDVVNNTDNFNLSVVNSKVTGTGEVKGVFSSVTGTGSSNKFGLYGEAINGTGINYGVFGEARRTGGVGTTYAIYGTASGAANNYAAYFDQGNVFISNNLGIGVASPARSLDVAGDAYIDSVFTDSLVAQFGSIDSLRIGNAYSFPSTTGTSGQVLEYNGSGDLVWTNVSGASDSTRLTDADNDTRITVESSTDEDYIRFFTKGREYLTIDTAGKIGINMSNPAARLCLWDTLFNPGKLVGINSFVYGDGIGNGDTLIANQAYVTGDGEFKFGYYSKVYGAPLNSYYAFYGEATGGADNYGLLTRASSSNNSYGARVEVDRGNWSVGYSAAVEAEGTSGSAQGIELFVDSARFGTGIYMEVIGQSLGNAEAVGIDFIARDADSNFGILGQAIGNSSGSDVAVGVSVSASQAQQTVGVEAEAFGSAGGDTAIGVYGSSQSAELSIAGMFEAIGYGGAADTSIGVYGSAISSSVNYAGYFDQGNVFVGDTLIIPTGATNGYVLTSDADGKATWQLAAGGSSVWDTNATSVFLPTQKNLRIGGNDTALSDIHLGAFGHLQWADLGGDSSMLMSQNLYYDGTNLKYTLDGPSSLFFAAEEEAGIVVSRPRPAGSSWNINNDALTSFRVDGGGIGINTDTPDHALDIEPINDSIGIIIRSNLSDASSILITDSTNGRFMGLRPAEYLKSNYQIVFPDTAPAHNQSMVYDSAQSAFVWVTQSSAACPTGMDLVGGSLCIDNTERAAATWYVADSTCTSLGFQLADFGDWYGAVANATLTNETNDWEWVRNISQNKMVIVGNGGITNRSFQDPTLTATYRCTTRIE